MENLTKRSSLERESGRALKDITGSHFAVLHLWSAAVQANHLPVVTVQCHFTLIYMIIERKTFNKV